MNEKTINNWLDLAEYDLQTAKAMLDSGRYLYVAYTCQQTIEKLLKALFVRLKGQTPPYIHNLIQLSFLTDLEDKLSEDQKIFISKLNSFYLESRYSEDLHKLSREIDSNSAKYLYDNTLEQYNWLKKMI